MDLSTISTKHCNSLEQQLTQLLKTMRSAKMQEHNMYEPLKQLEEELAELRRNRFDKTNSEYAGF